MDFFTLYCSQSCWGCAFSVECSDTRWQLFQLYTAQKVSSCLTKQEQRGAVGSNLDVRCYRVFRLWRSPQMVNQGQAAPCARKWIGGSDKLLNKSCGFSLKMTCILA